MSLSVGIDYRAALQNTEGIGRYTRELVRALLALDEDCDWRLYGSTLAGAKIAPTELGIEGATLRRWRIPSRLQPALLSLARSGADRFLGGTDVFHHTQFSPLPVRSAREVATIHDCIYLEGKGYVEPAAAERMAGAARRLAERATRVIVPSRYVAGVVARELGVDAQRVVVTPLGCDHALEHDGEAQRAELPWPYVLTVTRVDMRKNHGRMLRAFELLVREGLAYRWVIAGAAGYGSGEFERALAESPVRDRVLWRRSVSEEELAALFRGASLFLFTSLSEGFGLPPLEAMARGVPVVASNTTSLPEVCGDAAELVDPTDVAATFDAARRVLADRGFAGELARRGRARARGFRWEGCARGALEAYRASLA